MQDEGDLSVDIAFSGECKDDFVQQHGDQNSLCIFNGVSIEWSEECEVGNNAGELCRFTRFDLGHDSKIGIYGGLTLL